MTTLHSIAEPNSLLVTWQPKSGGARFLVATISRQTDGYVFTYLTGSKDFELAKNAGFNGHPAFNQEVREHSNNVLDPFLRRLPPKSRGDFGRYLQQHCLPNPFHASDFALLGYTGAKSPADGFILFPDFTDVHSSFDYLLEVAGTRYETALDLAKINLDDPITLVPEDNNQFDENAIALYHPQGKIGYVNKVFCKLLRQLLPATPISASIAKKNGTAERPLLYLLLSVDLPCL